MTEERQCLLFATMGLVIITCGSHPAFKFVGVPFTLWWLLGYRIARHNRRHNQ